MPKSWFNTHTAFMIQSVLSSCDSIEHIIDNKLSDDVLKKELSTLFPSLKELKKLKETTEDFEDTEEYRTLKGIYDGYLTSSRLSSRSTNRTKIYSLVSDIKGYVKYWRMT